MKLISKEKRTANWNWRGVVEGLYRLVYLCFKHQVEKKYFVEKNFKGKFLSYLEFL